MDEVVAFITYFIEQEHCAFRAAAEERDERRYAAQRDIVGRMYGGFLTTGVSRPNDPDEQWFEQGPCYLAGIRPRALFQIKAYAHLLYGVLYRCYVSDTARASDTYFASLYVARKRAGLRIVAEYGIARARRDWVFRGGERVLPLGALVGLRQFQPPAHPLDQAEYMGAAAEIVALSALG